MPWESSFGVPEYVPQRAAARGPKKQAACVEGFQRRSSAKVVFYSYELFSVHSGNSPRLVGPLGVNLLTVDCSDTSDFVEVSGAFFQLFGVDVGVFGSRRGLVVGLGSKAAESLSGLEDFVVVYLVAFALRPLQLDIVLLAEGRTQLDGSSLYARFDPFSFFFVGLASLRFDGRVDTLGFRYDEGARFGGLDLIVGLAVHRNCLAVYLGQAAVRVNCCRCQGLVFQRIADRQKDLQLGCAQICDLFAAGKDGNLSLCSAAAQGILAFVSD